LMSKLSAKVYLKVNYSFKVRVYSYKMNSSDAFVGVYNEFIIDS